MAPIKVLVVDDSVFMRKILTDVLSSKDGIKVVGTASNGKEALEKISILSPDIITLDIEMPIMNGLECLRHIMQSKKPNPVIMLSSLTSEGAEETIQALEIGAVDFVTKPQNIFKIKDDDKFKGIVEKIRMAEYRVPHPSFVGRAIARVSAQRPPAKPAIGGELKKIVAIGTSTGGPKSLQDVIPFLPASLPAAVVIVQHMPPGFTKSLASRLNLLSGINVKEAEDGDKLEAGWAYIAPGDFHMTFKKDTVNNVYVKLNKDRQINGHRPAVDVMMKSLSQTGLNNIIGVIMTGMGADGFEGLKSLKSFNRAPIIAQDKDSCVVYGMPRVVVEGGIADRVVPLNEISNEIIKMIGV